MKRVLGIDPGTGILGFGVVDHGAGGKLSMVDAGVIRTPAGQSDELRLLTIYDELKLIIETSQPRFMCVEKLYFSRNVTTAMTVSQARGVVLLLAAQFGLDLYELTPLQIKQSVSGNGKADKHQVQEMVRQLLGLSEIPKPDDCADALAAAIACNVRQKLYF